VKHFIDTGAGVVDEDYRGTVGVVLFNHGDADYQGGLLLVLHGATSHQQTPAAMSCP
jgi:dUTPase